MGGSTPSRLQVALASLRTYALDVLALYTTWGFVMVRLSIPAFMIATAWALSRIASPEGLLASLGYESYVAYVALGMAFFSMMTSTLFEVGERLHREMVQGTLETIMVTPASRAAWLAGTALGSLAISIADVALVLLYYVLLFGTGDISLSGAPLALAALAMGVAGMAGLGILLGGIVINLKEPHAFNVMLTPFLILLTGMMFPVEALPQALQVLARAIPLTHTIELVREALLLGSSMEDGLGRLAFLAAQAAFYIVVGLGMFTVLERRSRRVGGLSTF